MQGTSHVISNNSSHDETLEVETNDSSYPKSSVADPSYNSIGHTYNLDDGAANQDMQMQMEQSMQRSVTLVFWYKPKCHPIRLPYSIPTFPLFQLSHFPSLTSDLGLSSASYVDAYVPHTGQWEQHLITTVRFVERNQRLLYRVRKSLLDGLSEEDCPGLVDELDMQPLSKQVQSPKSQSPNRSGVEGIAGPSNGASKRPASDTPEFSPATKIYIMDGSQNTPAEHHTPPDETFASTSTKSPTNGSRVYFTGPHAPLPFYLTRPHSPIPYHPHPPLKQWPNDYTVSEIAAGFRLMDGLVAQTPTVVQRTAFERVFGCRYVKSTVCRHRGVWRRANAELREAFEALGADEKAVWGEFVRRVEGRPPGKIGQSKDHILAQSQGQTALICDHEPSSVVGALPGRPVQEEEEAEEEESFMRSLELPHPTVHQNMKSRGIIHTASRPSGHAGHGDAYDPVLQKEDLVNA